MPQHRTKNPMAIVIIQQLNHWPCNYSLHSNLLLLWGTEFFYILQNCHQPDECKQILFRTGRCFVCFKKHHCKKDCWSSKKCLKCQGRHQTSICSATGWTTIMTARSCGTTYQEQLTHASPPNVTPQSRNAFTLLIFVYIETPVL